MRITPMLAFISLIASPVFADEPIQQIQCGVHLYLRSELGQLPPGGLKAAPEVDTPQNASIVLNVGPTLAGNAQALAAWNRAADTWESWLEDNVTVTIDADMAPLGPGILGGTSTRDFTAAYTTIRNQVVLDAASDETIATQVPTAASFTASLTPGFTWSGNMRGTKAVLRALGFDMSFDDPIPDADIVFSTNFNWDYDNSDGVDAGKFDFEGIAFHEMGHALGFSSIIDVIEFVRSQGGTAAVEPTPMDLFRIRPGQSGTFSTTTRIMASGDTEATQVCYDGSTDLGMSTGQFGDGRQASHWKADELTGTYLGIMDPTVAAGAFEELTANDLRLMGLMGWDLAEDCNDNLEPDAEEVMGGNNDCNTNGVPDDCDIASGTSQDDNFNGIPDECEPTDAGDGLPSAFALHANHPNPFNPTTTISFDLPAAANVNLRIFDIGGRLVRQLISGESYTQGTHHVVWHGRNDAGQPVASGLYFYEMRAAGFSQVRKMTLVQ